MEEAFERNFNSLEVGLLSLLSLSQAHDHFTTHEAVHANSIPSPGHDFQTRDSGCNANAGKTTTTSDAHGSALNAQPLLPLLLPVRESSAAGIGEHTLSIKNTLLTQ